MSKENISKVDQSYDFGFSFEYEPDIQVIKETVAQDLSGTIASKEDTILDLKKRLNSVGKIILPLLEQLSKEPDKPMIKWENRKPILDKHIKQIKSLVEVT